MSTTIRAEQALTVHGVEARAFAVIATADGRIVNQTIKATRYYTEDRHSYRIVVELRFDDQCKNGHESFAITAYIGEAIGDGRYREHTSGCCHDEIAKRFPELAHLIPWHLTSTDGPMHYLANTVYAAGDRDYRGLRKGESRQLRNGKTGELAWIMKGVQTRYHDGPMPPSDSVTLHWEPWLIEGEGKARELEHARSHAVWPEATDAELCQEPEALRAALEARLPALLAQFKRDMLAVGFVWPKGAA